MPNGLKHSESPMRWSGVVVGAGFALLLTLAGGVAVAATGSPAVAILSSAIALFLAGLLTTRMLPSSQPVEPAAGAALVILLASLVEISVADALPYGATVFQAVASLVLAVLVSLLLAWAGGALGVKLRSASSHPASHGT